MDIHFVLESILFVASKPLTKKRLSQVLDISIDDIDSALSILSAKYDSASGIQIIITDTEVQMVTNPTFASVVEQFVRNEAMGELTKAQLETLTVIAYRGPITRPELEEVRGVNCAVILRNLLVRGLITEREQENGVLLVYEISIDALRHLGILTVKDLPEYNALHTSPVIQTNQND